MTRVNTRHTATSLYSWIFSPSDTSQAVLEDRMGFCAHLELILLPFKCSEGGQFLEKK